jgi:hypothetical protein
MMRNLLLVGAMFGLIGLASPARAELILDFSSAAGTSGTGATVHFVGLGGSASMTFPNNTALHSFVITASNSGSVPNAVGLFGDIGSPAGGYAIGPVTTVLPGFETAPVSGAGTLTIHDGMGFDLTGSLTWNSIASIFTAGSVNLTGTVNLTGITYGGTNPDLVELASPPSSGVTVLTFQFPTTGGATDLISLEASGAVNDSSYSGTIVTPEPSSLVLLAMGGSMLGGLGLLWRRRQQILFA